MPPLVTKSTVVNHLVHHADRCSHPRCVCGHCRCLLPVCSSSSSLFSARCFFWLPGSTMPHQLPVQLPAQFGPSSLCPGGPSLWIRRRLHRTGAPLRGKSQPRAVAAISPAHWNGGFDGGTARLGPRNPGSTVLVAKKNSCEECFRIKSVYALIGLYTMEQKKIGIGDKENW